jgi:hypothetical protein
MYRKDGLAMHFTVTCIGDGGFLCAFGGFYVNSFIFRNKTICICRIGDYLCNARQTNNTLCHSKQII